MLIPAKYALLNGAEVPEGSTSVLCGLCGTSFAVPDNEVSELTQIDVETVTDDKVSVYVCSECADKADQLIAQQNVAEMKGDNGTEDVINKALGS